MQQTTNKEFKADGDVAQRDQNIYEVALKCSIYKFTKCIRIFRIQTCKIFCEILIIVVRLQKYLTLIVYM